jgi:hypothetical protein
MKRLTLGLALLGCVGWALVAVADDTSSPRRLVGLHRLTPSEAADVAVYAYWQVLTDTDRLQDGPEGEDLGLEGDTFLIWVDRAPGYRFTHPTAYILVSGDGVRVVDGGWWPVLNGQRILYGKQNHASIVSPLEVGSAHDDRILVHIYPEELGSGDVLADGDEVIDVMSENTFFVWVDLLPDAFFTHPTAYLLVAADGRILVQDGGWWPVLNGKTVLYGSVGRFAAEFPFSLR